MADIKRAKGEKPEQHPLTPRPGWTQEQEYIALSDEFFAVEEDRDRLAEQLRGAVERAERAEALLRRLDEWDHMQTAGDGPYWLREIDACLTTDRGSSTMAVIARWWLIEDPDDDEQESWWTASAASADQARREGETVVEYVPADQSRGAVEERDAAVRSLESANRTIEWLAEQNERFRAELGLPPGGQ